MPNETTLFCADTPLHFKAQLYSGTCGLRIGEAVTKIELGRMSSLPELMAVFPQAVELRVLIEAHRKVQLHFTPTYSSWLNQVELWFSKIERDVIARGVFTSLPDLKRKLMRYIRHYNQAPKYRKVEVHPSHQTNHFPISRYRH